jgi:hypothetical protein
MRKSRHLQLLTAYVDGELDARQRKLVERLLAKSEEARLLLAKLESDSKELRDLPRHDAPTTLTDLVMETVSEVGMPAPLPVAPAAAASPNLIPVWLGLALAACVLLAVTLGTFILAGALLTKPGAEVAKPSQPVGIEKQPEQAPAPQLDPLVADLVSGAASKFADKVPNKDVGMRLVLSELHDEAVQKRLALELQKQAGMWVDVPATSTVKAVERVTEALQKSGFKVLAKKEAKAAEGKKYLLYAENVRPEELARIFEQLAIAAPAARTVEQVVVKSMTKDDHETLAAALNVPSKDVTPQKLGGNMVDIPILVDGGPPPKDNVGRTGKPLERYALLLPLGSGNPANSPELKQFLQERQAQNRGAFQIVLIIHDKQSM